MTTEQIQRMTGALEHLAKANNLPKHNSEAVRGALGTAMNLLTDLLEQLDDCKYHVERRRKDKIAGPTPAQAWHCLAKMGLKRIQDSGNDDEAFEEVARAMCDDLYADLAHAYNEAA